MGCFASKFISRSMSLKEELKKSKKRPANNRVPESEDMEDQKFLALVCTATKQASAVTSNKKWEFIASQEHHPLNLKEELVQAQNNNCFPSQESSDGTNSNEEESGAGAGRTRSFHTVEEYDAIMEKQVQESSSRDTNTSAIEKATRPQEEEEEGGEEEEMPSQKERGYKRKCIATRLESLEIPEAIELPAVASLREWLQLQVNSPGRFGTNSLPMSVACNVETSVFNPEMIAACEECMQQLEAEAETILQQITETQEQ